MLNHRELPAFSRNSHGGLASIQPWERQPTDTDKSFEAFEVYRRMGASRSLLKVSQQLVKSTTLLSRWSMRHGWVERCRAWDTHQSRYANELELHTTAEMRRRMVTQAIELQTRAMQRVLKMTDTEIAALTPYEVCLLMRTGSEMEHKAREIGEERNGSPSAPQFTIQIIRPGENMVGVQLPGVPPLYGYISKDKIEEFRRDHPDAVVIA